MPIAGPPATDAAAWPSWDPHEEQARLYGPFAPGTKGWNKPKGAPAGTFAITAVEPERMWSARAGIPFGSLRADLPADLGEGRTGRHAPDLQGAGDRDPAPGAGTWLSRAGR
jgi:hypothetical protein